MAKVSLNKLNLPKTDTFTEIEFNGIKVSVKKHIDAIDAHDIIDRALGAAIETHGVSEVIADSILCYWLLSKQTNLDIKTDIILEDALTVVDKFTRSGLLELILNEIEEKDYDYLIEQCELSIIKADKFITSTAVAINKFGNDIINLAVSAGNVK